MKVLGIWDGHDAGAALVADGRVVAAINEERLSRRKLDVGFPVRSIQACLELADMGARELDVVAASTSDPAKTLTRVMPSLKEEYYLLRRRLKDPGRLDSLKKRFKYRFTELGPNILSKKLSRAYLEKQLRKTGITASLELVDHHEGHAWAAACASGFEECAVITLDGVGDGLCGSLWKWEHGRLQLLRTLNACCSPGIFFEHVTNLMNMRELEDEGKVMALANFAFPVPDAENPMHALFQVDGFSLKSPYNSGSLFQKLKKILWYTPSEQFAYMAQQTLEKIGRELVREGMELTRSERLAVAGGLFANVKLNMQLAEMDQVAEISVFPHMGDGGLALGSALAVNPPPPEQKIFEAPLLGPCPDEEEMKQLLEQSPWHWERVEDIGRVGAELILNGKIILWFQGKMEFGPRSLGCRSILARPDDARVKDELNLVQKKRVWYQPFCPSMLREDADKLLELGTRKDADTNRYMTTAFTVRPEFHQLMLAVTNVDHTCRPHLVGDENPPFRVLLECVREKLGHGVVLNTSCNIHGEPMVCSVVDMLDMFKRTGINYLCMGPFLVSRKAGRP
jgi:carbamoyltransferase